MKCIIANKFSVIQNPSSPVLQMLKDRMSYTDKSVQYQLKRMERNTFQRNSGYYKKLQKEVNKSLLKDMQGGVAFNSGLSYMLDSIKDLDIEDRRCDTGDKVALPWVTKPFDPRPYQEEAIEKCLENWRGIVNMATGLGKTLTAIHLVRRLGRKTLIVVPSASIAAQFHEELCSAFGESRVGFYGGGKKKIKDITVGIAASVVKDTDKFKDTLGCVIIDECHHIAASTFYDITTQLGDVGRIYGLTATEYRSDGKDIMIHAGCGDIIVRRDIKWGIQNGFLAKPKFIVREVDTLGNDIKNNKLKCYKEHVLNNDVMKKQILEDIQDAISRGKSVLCLVSEVSHGHELEKQTGLQFAHGSDKDSQKYVGDLNAGRVKGLIGTSGRIGEGTDTRNVDVLIMAQFTASKGPVIQAVGRGLRKQDDKTECEIYDYIPKGSTMLSRHAKNRIKFYKEITGDVDVI